MKEKFLQYTVILNGDLHANFADKFDALNYSDVLAAKRNKGSFVETFDTKGGLTLLRRQNTTA